MKVYTLVEWQWDGARYVRVRAESFDYEGPVALCDRSQSKQVANQGMSQSATDQGNAQAALSNANSAVADYNKNLGSFMRFGRRTYGANGDFMKNANAQATTQAAAGSKAISGDLALQRMRTGSNTGGFAASEAEARRQGSRDLTGSLISADSDRLKQLAAINQYGVEASKYPAGVYGSIYGTSTGGASSNLNPAANAAREPGLFDSIFQPLVGAGATLGASAIRRSSPPAKG